MSTSSLKINTVICDRSRILGFFLEKLPGVTTLPLSNNYSHLKSNIQKDLSPDLPSVVNFGSSFFAVNVTEAAILANSVGICDVGAYEREGIYFLKKIVNGQAQSFDLADCIQVADFKKLNIRSTSKLQSTL